MKKQLAIVACVTLSLAMQAPAITVSTIFSDTFDTENGGVGFLNYGTPNQNGAGGTGTIQTHFANWTVTAGSVDLIPLAPTVSPNYDFFPGQGHGLYVDLDGTTGQAGTLTSKTLNLAAGSYLLSFDLAGSQRGEAKTTQISVQVGIASLTIPNLSATAPFATYDLPFTLASPTSVNLVFQDLSQGDDVGALLDNVTLTTGNDTPIPDGGATVSLLGMALLGLSALRQKLAK